MLPEREEIVVAEEVAPDFFEQGQALHQVPRQSLVNIARDRVKVRIIVTLSLNLIWDVFLAAMVIAYWVKLKLLSPSHVQITMQKEFC